MMVTPMSPDIERTMESMQVELHEMKGDVASIKRTLVGEPLEGNQGMLTRMQTAERRLAVLLWTLPIWITGGTALGQYLLRIWGI